MAWPRRPARLLPAGLSGKYPALFRTGARGRRRRPPERQGRHVYHTAILGGDSLILERTDFSARIAYVDYDGAKTYENFQNNPPKSASEEEEFVKINAPRVVSGIKMIESYFENIKKKTSFIVDERLSTLKIPN